MTVLLLLKYRLINARIDSDKGGRFLKICELVTSVGYRLAEWRDNYLLNRLNIIAPHRAIKENSDKYAITLKLD